MRLFVTEEQLHKSWSKGWDAYKDSDERSAKQNHEIKEKRSAVQYLTDWTEQNFSEMDNEDQRAIVRVMVLLKNKWDWNT